QSHQRRFLCSPRPPCKNSVEDRLGVHERGGHDKDRDDDDGLGGDRRGDGAAHFIPHLMTLPTKIAAGSTMTSQMMTAVSITPPRACEDRAGGPTAPRDDRSPSARHPSASARPA